MYLQEYADLLFTWMIIGTKLHQFFKAFTQLRVLEGLLHDY